MVLGFSIAEARAQIAKDLPPGTTRDAVIQAYGWPKGRSATATREIWTYEKFQIIIENDRVVEVSAMPPPSKINSSTRSPAVRDTRIIPSAIERAAATQALNVPRPQPSTPNSPAAKPVTVIRVPATLTQIQPRPTAPPIVAEAPPPAPTSGLAWPIITSIVLVAGISFFVVYQKTKEATAAPHPSAFSSPPTANAPQKTWKDHVAESLQGKVEFPPSKPPPSRPAQFSAALIRELEWKRFELLISLYFNATGVRAECTQIGADGGIDVKLYRPGETRPYSYVQCKAWGSELVGVSLVRELFGVIAADKLSEGVFATTSNFTPEARLFATANHISLLTTAELLECLHRLPAEKLRGILEQVTEGDYTTPSCPQCDRKMVWKDKAGFWGCPKYPVCRSSPIYPRVRATA